MAWHKYSVRVWEIAYKKGMEYHEIVDMFPFIFTGWPDSIKQLKKGAIDNFPSNKPCSTPFRHIYHQHRNELHEIHRLEKAIGDLDHIMTTMIKMDERDPVALFNFGARLYLAWIVTNHMATKTIRRNILNGRVDFKTTRGWATLNPARVLETDSVLICLPYLTVLFESQKNNSFRLVRLTLKFNIVYGAALDCTKTCLEKLTR
mgnify:FL=1